MTSKTDIDAGVGGFAAVLNSRLAAQARVRKAIAAAWTAGGVAVAASLTGLGLAFALYGYSYLISIEPAGKEIVKALVIALENSKYKAVVSDDMNLAPNTEIRIAPAQKVGLEENTIVRLEPNSTVRVAGDLRVNMPQPSAEQLQLNSTSTNNELPFTSYTIFRSVPYASGEVVTGWNFELSDSLRPKAQYCYYTKNLDKGIAAKYTLAFDGSPNRPSPLAKLSFDFDGAIANCIWFSGA